MAEPTTTTALRRVRLSRAGDIAPAIGAIALDLWVCWDWSAPDRPRPPLWSVCLMLACTALAGLVLLGRQKRPLLVLAIISGYSVVFGALSFTSLPTPAYLPIISVWLALYSVAAGGKGRSVYVAPAIAAVPVALTVAYIVAVSIDPVSTTLPLVASMYGFVTFGAWGAGRGRRASRAHMEQLEFRRRAETKEAANRVRLTVARELHDVIARTVTHMALQAAGAAKLLRTDAAAAEESLDRVQSLSTQAMDELREMLLILRAGGDAPPEQAAVTEQSGRLNRLADLLDQVGLDSLNVTLTVTGTPRVLDAGTDLAGWRLIQEALINSIKHAGVGGRARVTLRWADDLRIEIDDDGDGQPAPALAGFSTGNGLRGQHERIRQAGGTLRYGPRPEGGFSVVAHLPITVPAQPIATTGFHPEPLSGLEPQHAL
ncbi:two-component sensor histidine kinase [Paractinoplanes abujensis]|uniref:histidine kinase n=1 Tax=Paractinoplanes abujensis TaxID=882441 RepID=A0A7W7CSJ3_9ACTN|nr:histidine kinase [Actinoplanes abujensis]MBB4693898.1 signal transduction histidine kinase [Actinoplanes abujensis]GID21446.1 two-component sensor histidine kinase [Actinoplanes abujensis]